MINHSLDYIKKRIKDDTCINMPIEEFQNMNIMPFLSCYDKDYYPLTKSNVTNKINADLRYSPFANFNYFITETCICDGTLLFITELIQRIIHKIKIIQTCHQPTMELFLKNGEMPKDFANKNVIHYEVGDFVVNSYITKLTDKEKPWMNCRLTVMLPVKFTITKQ